MSARHGQDPIDELHGEITAWIVQLRTRLAAVQNEIARWEPAPMPEGWGQR